MSDIASLRERTNGLLEQILGEPVAQRNEAGDWFLTYGSAGILVSVVEGPDDGVPAVLVASPIVSDTEKSPGLLDTLNDINSSLRFGRAYWANGFVWVATNLVAETLDPEELPQALSEIGNWSDTLDEAFVQGFGGVQPFAPKEPLSGAWTQPSAAVGATPGPG